MWSRGNLLLVLLINLASLSYQAQDCSRLQSIKAKKLCRDKEEEMFWSLGAKERMNSPDVGLEAVISSTTPAPGPASATLPAFSTDDPRYKGPILYTTTTPRTTTDYWSEELPNCDTLPVEEERKEGDNCKIVEVEKEPEIRYRDQVFEKLLPQIWKNYQRRINFEKNLYGLSLEPLSIPDIEYNYTGDAAAIDIRTARVQVHGLSTIDLKETLVTRSLSLHDIDIKMVFRFDQLFVNGSYSAKGALSYFYEIDTEGLQPLYVSMVDATVTAEIKLEYSEEYRFGCDPEGSVQIKDLRVPLSWSDISLYFENAGFFANSVMNMAGVVIIKSQNDNLVEIMKDKIKQEINSLLC